MKKFLSILIALALLISMFSLTALAFAEDVVGDSAEENKHAPVTFNADKFKSEVIEKDGGLDFWVEMDKNFTFENKWWKDAKLVHEIFDGINYRMQPEQNLEDKEQEFTLTIDYGNPDGEDNKYTNATEPDPKTYKETESVTLPAAPAAVTENESPVAYFAGWKISLTNEGGELPIYLQGGAFAAGAKIAMPDKDITATAVWKKTQEEADKEVVHDDVIYVIYVTPSGSYTEDMKNWTSHSLTSSFSLTTQGKWYFRFVVVDGAKASESGYSFDYDDVLATTYDNVQKLLDENKPESELEAANCTLVYNVKDTTAPEIELSTTQKNKVGEGLTVGTSYSISTSLNINDCSATSSDVTYKVYKKVGTDVEGTDSEGWLLIYDSTTSEVTEGYEKCISTSGTITPLDEDVSDSAVYRIVYTIKDKVSGKYGIKAADNDSTGGTEDEYGYHPIMELKVKQSSSDNKTQKTIEAWKIVLYVIAGLSAVGIVVLLCIKPKQQTADGRYSATANGNSNASAQTNSNAESQTSADTESEQTSADTGDKSEDDNQ